MRRSRVWLSGVVAALTGTLCAQKPVHDVSFEGAGLRKIRGSIRGDGQVLKKPLPPALVFRNREDRVLVSRSIRNARLPHTNITIEAWASVDTPRAWGGLFSALQDNGGFEKGLLLGYRGDRFCFALASKGADDGDGKLTYIYGPSLRPGRFHHIVGVYDGAEMKIYVDGKLGERSKAQSGPILYPRRAVVELGSYHDDDEDYPLAGLIGRVRVWSTAFDAAAVQREFAAGATTYLPPQGRPEHTLRLVATKSGLEHAAAIGPVAFEDNTTPTGLSLAGKTKFTAPLPKASTSAFSIATTFMPSGNRRRQTLVKTDGWELSVLDDKVRLAVDGTIATVGESLRAYRWHHIAGTWDGSLLRLYLNGKARSFARTKRQSIELGATLHLAEGLQGKLHEVTWAAGVWSPEEVRVEYERKKALFPESLRIELGPIAQFVNPGHARVRWRSGVTARSTWVEVVDTSGALQRVAVRTEKGGMSVAEIARMRAGRRYDYRILVEDAQGRQRASETFSLDTDFDFSIADVLPPRPSTGQGPWTRNLPVDRGYVVVLGGDAKMALELAADTRLQIVLVEPDAAKAKAVRTELVTRGVYGAQVSMLRCPFDQLTVGSDIANVVVVATDQKISAEEIDRICRPLGGLVLDASGKLLRRQAKTPNTGDWTHQYGSGANTAASGDDLVGGALELQWFGRPGPRPMMDRGCRSPAPLSTHGRLFIHGDRRLIGLDSYNGAILWSLEIPPLRRTNVPRDCSNLTAHKNDLFAAVVDQLWRIDGQTGALAQVYEIPGALRPEGDPAWGFLYATDTAVVGTATRVSATYRGAEGEWFDKAGPDAEEVLGNGLFSLDKTSGEVQWKYQRGMILHPTITTDKGVLYFVEDRKPSKASRSKFRLVDQTGSHQYLVALELATGKQIWERKYDFRKFKQVFYLSLSQGVLVTVGVSNQQYHVHAFDASSGAPKWQHAHKWRRNHHGGGVQHPVILGGVIYVEFKGLSLEKGKVVNASLPNRRGCGTMSGSGNSLFYRHYDQTMFDPISKHTTTIPGIRSGCWLSLIPAGGLLLAPESSSGCSCANPIQTSVAYRPKPREK